jgi:hypothetical protein
LNTKIFLNGNTCTYAGAPGYIQYWATASGEHVFYNANSEKMRIDDNVSTTGYIFAGGTVTGLRINGNDYGEYYLSKCNNNRRQPGKYWIYFK